MLRPGRSYIIINRKSGTAIDLSGADHTSIISYDAHWGDNQKWTFLPYGDNTWAIRGISGRSIGVQGGPRDGARVIGIPDLMPWQILPVEGDPDHYFITFLDGNLNLSLSNEGETYAPAELSSQSDSAIQMWKIQEI